MCLPLIEASLSKLPIIIRDIEVFNWLVHDYSSYKGKNMDDFVIGIKKILNNPSYREKLIKNALGQIL